MPLMRYVTFSTAGDATTVADLTLTDVAFGTGLLTAVFGFYARFIRPSLVSTIEWRKNLETRVDKLQMRIEMHSETDTTLLSAVQLMGRDIGEIKTKIAVLEERSQRWGS